MDKGIARQYYTVGVANLITLIYGISVGWPSSSLPLLMSPESPLPSGPISLEDASWISSILCIGGAVGTIFYGWLSEYCGRKVAMLTAAIPTLVTWILFLVAENVIYLYIARALAGFAGGASFAIVPKIVAEISDDKVRGSLGSLLILIHNGGIVIGYILCSYLEYHIVPWFVLGFLLLFVLGFVPVPDTSKYWILKGEMSRAEYSYRYYRGIQLQPDNYSSPNVIRTILENQAKEDQGNNINLQLKDFFNRSTINAILIGVNGMTICSFAGTFTLASYSETIFKEAGSTLSPQISSITIACILFLGSYMATLLVERMGRKILIVATAYVSAFCLTTIGVYLCLKQQGYNIEAFSWLPVVALSVLMFFAASGASSTPFVVIGEIFSQKVRAPLVTLCTEVNWFWSFVLVKIFPFMLLFMGMHGALWTMACVCAILTTIFAIMMPETKGKSIEHITDLIGRRK